MPNYSVPSYSFAGNRQHTKTLQAYRWALARADALKRAAWRNYPFYLRGANDNALSYITS
jgi:hypothetical protein